MEDPIEVQPPGSGRFFIILCMNESGESIPSGLLDDHLLDLRHGPAIGSVVSELCIKRITGSTHVVSCSIASHTD
jgi:hypothetical protein